MLYYKGNTPWQHWTKDKTCFQVEKFHKSAPILYQSMLDALLGIDDCWVTLWSGDRWQHGMLKVALSDPQRRGNPFAHINIQQDHIDAVRKAASQYIHGSHGSVLYNHILRIILYKSTIVCRHLPMIFAVQFNLFFLLKFEFWI